MLAASIHPEVDHVDEFGFSNGMQRFESLICLWSRHPSLPADKVALRREARERRREFIRSLERDQRDAFEQAWPIISSR